MAGVGKVGDASEMSRALVEMRMAERSIKTAVYAMAIVIDRFAAAFSPG